MPDRKNKINNGIQILRSIACLLVFLSHYNVFHHMTGFFEAGAFGVSIFIVLSGFLKTAYNSDIQSTPLIKRFNLKQTANVFSLKIGKIYPLHIITMIMALPYEFFMLMNGSSTVFHLIVALALNVLMMQSLILNPLNLSP